MLHSECVLDVVWVVEGRIGVQVALAFGEPQRDATADEGKERSGDGCRAGSGNRGCQSAEARRRLKSRGGIALHAEKADVACLEEVGGLQLEKDETIHHAVIVDQAASAAEDRLLVETRIPRECDTRSEVLVEGLEEPGTIVGLAAQRVGDKRNRAAARDTGLALLDARIDVLVKGADAGNGFDSIGGIGNGVVLVAQAVGDSKTRSDLP